MLIIERLALKASSTDAELRENLKDEKPNVTNLILHNTRKKPQQFTAY